ncbi:MAG: sugar transferase [Bacteroidota bacterium]|nr:sugar transferase [Bacteroidota bacterium]
MITGTTFLSPSDVVQHNAELPATHLNSSEKGFLYIGRAANRTSKCLSFFDRRHNTVSLFLAREHLLRLKSIGDNLPDVIIIDIPFNYDQLIKFNEFLHSHAWSSVIPIIYNETALNKKQLTQLKAIGVADDIVNVSDYCNELYKKASFLKKVKSHAYQKKVFSNGATKATEINKISYLKRIFDILLATFLLALLIPVFIFIIIAIKLESKGPAIYTSKRAGRGFKVFNFFKFRTMVADAENRVGELSEFNLYGSETNSASFFKIKNDPRITRVGAFLRNTSLDELPQLINVLKGEMSIVGNRPLPLYEASTLTTNEGAERFLAPAGITGLWQVTKRGREDMSAEERLSLDIDYARNHGFISDFRILLSTPTALFQKTNV